MQRSITGAHRAAPAGDLEVDVEFGCAARKVEARIERTHRFEHQIDRGVIHLLGAVRPGVHVAVHAGLVARVAEVHLQ